LGASFGKAGKGGEPGSRKGVQLLEPIYAVGRETGYPRGESPCAIRVMRESVSVIGGDEGVKAKGNLRVVGTGD